jgi:hypothetical protein
MNPPVGLDDALVRATTQEVLRRPEFHDLATTPWYVDLVARLRDWGLAFSRWAEAHPVQGWLVIAVLVLVLVGLLIHITYVAFGDVWSGQRRASDADRAALAWTVLEGAAMSWLAGIGRAQAALAAGDPRRAVWIAHRVLLGLMDEAGAIRFAAGKTNCDYLAECAPAHPWRELLGRLTGAYERIVYGHRDPAGEPLGTLLDAVRTCAAGPTS